MAISTLTENGNPHLARKVKVNLCIESQEILRKLRKNIEGATTCAYSHLARPPTIVVAKRDVIEKDKE